MRETQLNLFDQSELPGAAVAGRAAPLSPRTRGGPAQGDAGCAEDAGAAEASAAATPSWAAPSQQGDGFLRVRGDRGASPTHQSPLTSRHSPTQGSLFAGLEEVAPVELPPGFTVVDTPEALAHMVAKLAQAPHFALDTETTALDPMAAELVGLSFAASPGEAFYVPVGHAGGRQLACGQVVEALRPLLEDPGRPKVGHNLKFDLRVLARLGIHLRGSLWDTMIAAHLVHEEGGHGLKDCARGYLGRTMVDYGALTGGGRRPVRELGISEVARYACDDADATLCLWQHLSPQIPTSDLGRVFALETDLLPVVARMEEDGVAVDLPYLERLAGDLHRQMAAKAEECYAATGCRFNLDSPKQVASILYERLGLPVPYETATGPSTGEPALRALAQAHALPRRILEYRELSKLLHGYVLALPRSVSPATGRIHPNFRQIGARSGRFSCTDPNLQSLPKDAANTIRRAFVAAPGRVLLSADYSQIELRILAHCSQDPGLLAAFEAGEDVHARTAADVFGIALGAVTPEQRRVAKGINFGLVYGMSAQGLAAQLGVSLAEAERYVEAYFRKYSGVRRYMAETLRRGRAHGYVATLLGRRRRVGALNAADARTRGQAERQAINAPIQGTAADVIKAAMVRVAPHMEDYGASMILQVHDELVMEVPEERAEALQACVTRLMEAPPLPSFRVPLRVDAHFAATWN